MSPVGLLPLVRSPLPLKPAISKIASLSSCTQSSEERENIGIMQARHRHRRCRDENFWAARDIKKEIAITSDNEFEASIKGGVNGGREKEEEKCLSFLIAEVGRGA